jgi:hypothetical protein
MPDPLAEESSGAEVGITSDSSLNLTVLVCLICCQNWHWLIYSISTG